jgi:hypothetical protein
VLESSEDVLNGALANRHCVGHSVESLLHLVHDAAGVFTLTGAESSLASAVAAGSSGGYAMCSGRITSLRGT